MTPLQKRRHSTMRQGRRRSTQNLVLPQLTPCTNCKASFALIVPAPPADFITVRKSSNYGTGKIRILDRRKAL